MSEAKTLEQAAASMTLSLLHMQRNGSYLSLSWHRGTGWICEWHEGERRHRGQSERLREAILQCRNKRTPDREAPEERQAIGEEAAARRQEAQSFRDEPPVWSIGKGGEI